MRCKSNKLLRERCSYFMKLVRSAATTATQLIRQNVNQIVIIRVADSRHGRHSLHPGTASSSWRPQRTMRPQMQSHAILYANSSCGGRSVVRSLAQHFRTIVTVRLCVAHSGVQSPSTMCDVAETLHVPRFGLTVLGCYKEIYSGFKKKSVMFGVL